MNINIYGIFIVRKPIPNLVVYHKDGSVILPELKQEHNISDDSAGINISALTRKANRLFALKV